MPASPVPGRKYARDRLVDILHLRLDVTPDFSRRSIRAVAGIRLSPISGPQKEVTLDAEDLTITAVEATPALAGWQNTGDHLILTFRDDLPAGSEASVKIEYQVQPARGLYFRTPEMGYPAGDTQLWTQGQPEHHRWWFPCFDAPNERMTSEIICRVPRDMTVISNGRLVSREAGADGLTAWHWLQDKPHPNYLIALAAGYFHKVEDNSGSVPLALFVPLSEAGQADGAFRETKRILEFLERETGIPYPWDKYWQVYCHDFLAGGMENTSCTFMAARMLFAPETEELHSIHGINAHELVHQWFGDLVTCRDWAHLWLNEGAATYWQIRYDGERDGADGLHAELWRAAKRVLDSGDTRPMIWRDYQDPFEQFDSRAYPKGAWVLHMIRGELGADLFRRCIGEYLRRHRNGSVTSDDLRDVLEELTGKSFDRFFDQWLYQPGNPELSVDYSWDEKAGQAKLTVRQTHNRSSGAPVFHLNLPVRFGLPGDGGTVNFVIPVTRESGDFTFPLKARPELVSIDPELTVLARISFRPPPDMVKHQLEGTLPERLRAVNHLAEKGDDAAVELLAGVLRKDPYYYVRQEAVGALRKIRSDAARAVLIQETGQPDARVRLDVVRALTSFPDADAREALWKAAGNTRNPEILAAIIESFGARPGEPEVAAALRRYLGTTGRRHTVALAAISALRAQDDDSAVPAIVQRLRTEPSGYLSRDYARALQDVAALARNGTGREQVFALLTGHLSDPRDDVRLGAVEALGILGDPRATAWLEPLRFGSAAGRNPVGEAATRAISAIESRRTGPPELRRLWDELQQLRSAQEELRRKVEKEEPVPGKPVTEEK